MEGWFLRAGRAIKGVLVCWVHRRERIDGKQLFKGCLVRCVSVWGKRGAKGTKVRRGQCKREKETPREGCLLFRPALCCVGDSIGPGALLALIGGRQQPPICEHHARFGNTFRDPVPNLGTTRFGLGRFEQSLVALLFQSVTGCVQLACQSFTHRVKHAVLIGFMNVIKDAASPVCVQLRESVIGSP